MLLPPAVCVLHKQAASSLTATCDGGRQKHGTLLVRLKAEEFIIKNKNIKQEPERGTEKERHRFHNLFPASRSLLNASGTVTMTY